MNHIERNGDSLGEQPADQPTCLCCGEPSRSRFLPGHDAKLKSRLINTVLAPETEPGERRACEKQLKALGWTAHLEKARASRGRKAERKAAKS